VRTSWSDGRLRLILQPRAQKQAAQLISRIEKSPANGGAAAGGFAFFGATGSERGKSVIKRLTDDERKRKVFSGPVTSLRREWKRRIQAQR
jgi:hypothetical protein